MSPAELENALRELPQTGKLIKSRPYRQVWRFEFGGRPYYLKFYPRRGGALKRLIRGSPALREFVNLKAMSQAGLASPRATAHLSGFLLGGEKGDAVIIEGIEPSVQLDHHLSDLALRGERTANHRELARQVMEIVHKLGLAKLSHTDLHLGNFLLRDKTLYLLDGYAVRRGGMRMKDVLLLGHSVSNFATKTDLLRAWRLFSSAPLPRKNPVRRRQWRKFLESAVSDNAYFGRLDAGEWAGSFYRHCKFPRRWAPASQVDVTKDDWQRECPRLLQRIEADELHVLKRSRSGDVLSGAVTLGGREVEVVIKRPRRRKWYRYFNEIGRGSRAARAWKKAWSLVVRNVPTAWPLLVMERRQLGYSVDAIIVFERVAGTLLAELDFDAMSTRDRDTLFLRLGRTLRQLESTGLVQYDSKMTNWMIRHDPVLGPTPIIIDVDGIRRWFGSPLWSIDRLLRSMRQHPQYTPGDSRQLCLGYAPTAHLVREGDEHTPSPLEGEGGGEGEVAEQQVADEPRTEPSPTPALPPHPNPPPRGGRGPE